MHQQINHPINVLMTSSAPGTDVFTKPVLNSEPMLAPPAASTTASRPAQPCLRGVEHNLPGYGRLRTVTTEKCCWALIPDVARIAGRPIAEVTAFARSGVHVKAGEPRSKFHPPATRLFIMGEAEVEFADLEAVMPIFKGGRGSDFISRYLWQQVLPPVSDAPLLGPDAPFAMSRFTTDAGQFVTKILYSPIFGEIRAIVTGANVWISASSIASIIGIPVGSVVKLAGAGNFLHIPGVLLLTPIDPDGHEVYLRSNAAVRVIKGAASWDRLAEDIEKWIGDELWNWTKLKDAGAVVSLHGLHRILAPAPDYNDWLDALVGPVFAQSYKSPLDDTMSVKVVKIWLKRSNYASWIVWLLLQDDGVCHGGSVGETADEALVRIQPVFPDCNGQVSARALHAFLRRKRSFESWLRAHSHRLHPALAASKPSTRVRGDVLLSEKEALELLLRSIEDPADFRTTLTPSTKR